MRVRDFHAVDLDEDEIVQFFRQNAGIELRDNLSYGRRFARAGRAGNIDAGSCSGRDGGFEVRVDGGEFSVAAGQRVGHGRDVKGGAGDLEGGGGSLVGGENASAERGKFESLFYDDPVLTLDWEWIIDGEGYTVCELGLRIFGECVWPIWRLALRLVGISVSFLAFWGHHRRFRPPISAVSWNTFFFPQIR